MSILIKGVEMPETCYDCIFYGGLECSLTGFDADRKDRHCPLVELPPRGRLIDVSDFKMSFTAKMHDENGKLFVPFAEVARAIFNAPTIIEAEEDEK